MLDISYGQKNTRTQVKHYKMGRVSKSSTQNEKHSETHEIHENNEPTWKTRINRVAVEFASTFIGQTVMMQFDKLLWTLEKTATWISNGKTDGKRAKPPANLVRPLNWFLFLPTLVALRLVRVPLSLVSICLGFDGIEASTMVTFFHESQRTIENVLTEAEHQNRYRTSTIDSVKQTLISILSIVLSILSIVGSLFINDQTFVNNEKPINNKTPVNDAKPVNKEKLAHNEKPVNNKTPVVAKVPNNKASLNAAVTFAVEEVILATGEGDLDAKIYLDFLNHTQPSDTEDEDFLCNSNGEESDTDSQASVATEDLSDYEANEGEASTNEVVSSVPKHTNGSAPIGEEEKENLNTHSANTANCNNSQLQSSN